MFPVASRAKSVALPINDDDMLKIIFKFVVIANIVYASTVMHGAVLRTRRIKTRTRDICSPLRSP